MKIVTILDTETTGLLRSDKVICFGAILASLDEEANTLKFEAATELYNEVPVKISVEASRISGIDNVKLHQLAQGMTTREVGECVAEYIHTSDLIVGHNIISFDARMIQETYPIVGKIPYSKMVDTIQACQKHFGKRMKLEQAVKILKIPCKEDFARDVKDSVFGTSFHSALYDAYCTARLYAKLKGYTWIGDTE